MTHEQIVDFNRRISQSNRSELIVIMYEIFFAYMEDARESFEVNFEEYKAAVISAQTVLDRLMKTLDFSYDISKELRALYLYASKQLSVALYKNCWEEAVPAEQVMRKLYVAFEGVASQDDSEPLMRNAERVVAGMTYGRGSLVENSIDSGSNRGFLV